MDGGREKLRRALLAAPAERLLFETEAPSADAPGWRAGPAGLVEVIAAAAKISGRTAEELSALSWANGKIFTGR
jgi:Tat protein secretion system quality control protein TatD with DNase activity